MNRKNKHHCEQEKYVLQLSMYSVHCQPQPLTLGHTLNSRHINQPSVETDDVHLGFYLQHTVYLPGKSNKCLHTESSMGVPSEAFQMCHCSAFNTPIKEFKGFPCCCRSDTISRLRGGPFPSQGHRRLPGLPYPAVAPLPTTEHKPEANLHATMLRMILIQDVFSLLLWSHDDPAKGQNDLMAVSDPETQLLLAFSSNNFPTYSLKRLLSTMVLTFTAALVEK